MHVPPIQLQDTATGIVHSPSILTQLHDSRAHIVSPEVLPQCIHVGGAHWKIVYDIVYIFVLSMNSSSACVASARNGARNRVLAINNDEPHPFRTVRTFVPQLRDA